MQRRSSHRISAGAARVCKPGTTPASPRDLDPTFPIPSPQGSDNADPTISLQAQAKYVSFQCK